MKKKMLVVLFALFFSILVASICSADVLHLESKYGIIDYVSAQVGDQNLTIIYDYTNTTDDTVMPSAQYYNTAFQNGKELTRGFIMNLPEGCDYGSTSIRPGTTIRYCETFKLVDSSPVEVEVRALWDFSGKTKKTYLINVSEDSEEQELPAEEPQEDQAYTDLGEANKRIVELEKQLEEANAKIEELQGQLDTIKSALGN